MIKAYTIKTRTQGCQRRYEVVRELGTFLGRRSYYILGDYDTRAEAEARMRDAEAETKEDAQCG